MGVHFTPPPAILETMPGRTSTSSPTRSTPCKMEPPATPPFRFSASSPGLLTSKERMTMRRGSPVKFRVGTGTCVMMYLEMRSTLYCSWAEMGMMGALPATVPATNSLIWSYCALAASGLTRSILFCRMMMLLSCMISTAAKCSDVCGCGQLSLPAMSSIAASMTAAPFNMVAIRMSWPGQSTKDTWRCSCHVRSVPSSMGNSSNVWLLHERYS
mmetsp:Transcript_75854/g.153679  ORF Transcript_75854/g.153679 Transcript_75854/m.153679 type:complete len:214 (-) Transcript_75854:653-1294(-)